MSNKTKWFGYGIAAVIVLALLGWAVSAMAVAPADFGLKEGDVIRASGDPDIYIVNELGYKRLFVNPAIFNLYGHLGWSKVKEVAPSTRDAFATSGLFRNCESGDQKVYGLEVASEDVAVLHWVNMTGAQAVSEDPAFFNKVFCINNAEQALYGVGTAYTSLSQIPPYARGGAVVPPVAGFNPNGGTQGEILGWEVGYADEDELSEYQSGEVAVFEAELDDEGPLKLMSADLIFEQTVAGGQSYKPWDYFDSIALWVNGTKVATKDVDSDLFNKDGNEYRVRFSGLSSVFPSDETSTVAVSVKVGGIDSEDEGASWDVTLGDYRVIDESGLITSDEALETDSFDIDEPEVADVSITDASDEVDAKVIEVNGGDSDTTGVAVYAFDIEEEEGVDLTIDELELAFSTTTAAPDEVIKRAALYKGSTKLADEVVESDGSVIFEDLGLEIPADGKVTLTVKVDLFGNDDEARYAEGAQLSVEVVDVLAAEDENGNDEGDIAFDINAESNTHELRSEGVSLELISVDFDKTYSRDSGVAGDKDQATAVFVFKVTAFGDDAYVDADSADHSVSVSNGSVVASLLDSDAEELSEAYEVLDGATEEFELTLVVEPTAAGFVSVEFTGLKWDDDSAMGSPATFTFGLDDYETSKLFLQ